MVRLPANLTAIAVVSSALCAMFGGDAQAAGDLQIRARRGLAGIVPNNGIDWARVSVRNRGRLPHAAVLVVGALRHPVSVPAGGAIEVELWRDVPGRGELAAVPISVESKFGVWSAEIPAARVASHVTVVVEHDGARLAAPPGDFARGEFVSLRHADVPSWPGLTGTAVVARPRDITRVLARHAKSGGVLCLLGDGLRCVSGGDTVHRPLTPLPVASKPHSSQTLLSLSVASACFALFMLMLSVGWRRLHGFGLSGLLVVGVVVLASALDLRRVSPIELQSRGYEVAYHDDSERYFTATVEGFSPLGPAQPPALSAHVWARPIEGRAVRFELLARTTLPGFGSYRVQGFTSQPLPRWLASTSQIERPGVQR